MDKTHVVIAGNPGVGKSFILNTLIGQVQFKSGISIGEGMTNVLERYDAPDYIYFDTPGLADIGMREKAALEISKAIQGGCEMKLIFVVTLESGRLRPADLATIKIVLNAIEDVGVDASGRYSVIINKCNPALMMQFETMRPRETVRGTFSVVKHIDNIEFFPRLCAADDEENFLLQNDCGYANFVENAPTMRLPDNAKVRVDVSTFDSVVENYEKELDSVQIKIRELDSERNDITWKKLFRMLLRKLRL